MPWRSARLFHVAVSVRISTIRIVRIADRWRLNICRVGRDGRFGIRFGVGHVSGISVGATDVGVVRRCRAACSGEGRQYKYRSDQ